MKRPPVPHPLDIALRDRFARQAGIDPAQLAAWLEWREAPPRAVVDRLVAAFFPLVPPESFLSGEETLPSKRQYGTLHTMHTSEIEAPNPRGGRPSKLKRHPLMAALKKAGVSVAEEAANVRRSVSSVRSFCFARDNEAYRPVPRAIAERWRDVYGVPLTAWPRIAD